MRVFFDFEFTGLHQKTTPISLGMVAEDGRTFYAEFDDYDRDQITPWLAQNVFIHTALMIRQENPDPREMKFHTFVVGRRDHVATAAKDWLRDIGEKGLGVEMWGDTLAYDWVLFCELWGGALHLPDFIYYIPFDLATLFLAKGVDPDVSRIEYAEMGDESLQHNALHDARAIAACFKKLMREAD